MDEVKFKLSVLIQNRFAKTSFLCTVLAKFQEQKLDLIKKINKKGAIMVKKNNTYIHTFYCPYIIDTKTKEICEKGV